MGKAIFVLAGVTKGYGDFVTVSPQFLSCSSLSAQGTQRAKMLPESLRFRLSRSGTAYQNAPSDGAAITASEGPFLENQAPLETVERKRASLGLQRRRSRLRSIQINKTLLHTVKCAASVEYARPRT